MDLLSFERLLYLSLAAGPSAFNVHTFPSNPNMIQPSVLTYAAHLLPCLSASCPTTSYTYIFPEMSFAFKFPLFSYPQNITSQVNTIYLLANFPQITSCCFLFVLRKSRPLASNLRSSF